MMQQWTGINFIFYFGTTFFKELGTISNPFLIGLITTLVNVCSTPLSFWIIERYGRRTIMIYGALGMLICEFIVGIIGVTAGRPSQHNHSAVSSQIAFICIYIFFFATTWGPGKLPNDHHLADKANLFSHRRLGPHRRDLPPPHPFPWCCLIYCV